MWQLLHTDTWQLHTVSADVKWLCTQRHVESHWRLRLHYHLIVEQRGELQLHTGLISIDYMSLPCSQSMAMNAVYSTVLNCHAVADIMALAHRHWLQQPTLSSLSCILHFMWITRHKAQPFKRRHNSRDFIVNQEERKIKKNAVQHHRPDGNESKWETHQEMR